jgi:hypothetical protein
MASGLAPAQDDGDDGEVLGWVGLVWRFWEGIDAGPVRCVCVVEAALELLYEFLRLSCGSECSWDATCREC